MSLTTRLLVYFLAAMGLVLAGFSAATYAVARHHLRDRLRDRVSAVMDTLVAAAELEPDGIDWEPDLRTLPEHLAGDQVAWVVRDDDGNRLSGSGAPLPASTDASWWVSQQILRYPRPELVRDPPAGQPRTRHRALTIVVAAPTAAVEATLASLAWVLVGVSTGVWLTAAAAGRRLCRRAIAPVTRMCDAVNSLQPEPVGGRVPLPGSRDELGRLAAAFNHLLDRLETAADRQRRFAGEASHQLRTPLTALLGQLEVALRRDREPDEYRRVLSAAHAQASRLKGIVESLLFLARSEREQALPDLPALDLAAWLPSAVRDSWGEHPRFPDVTIQTHAASAATVRTHAGLLRQALDNLIDNAFKYSAPGTRVTVTLDARGSGWCIRVHDLGDGIAPDDVAGLFQPFFRTEAARLSGVAGTGLGLTVTARIVSALRGTVQCDRDVSRGVSFVIGLPGNADVTPPPAD